MALSFDEFERVMAVMVKSYGCDRQAADLSRPLRLPGTYHMKGEPQLVRWSAPGCTKLSEVRRYTREDILAAFPPPPEEAKPEPRNHSAANLDEFKSALAAIPVRARDGEDPDKAVCRDNRKVWLDAGMAAKFDFGESGRPAWDEWSEPSAKYNEAEQDRTWQSFKRESGEKVITARTIFKLARECGWKGFRADAVDFAGLNVAGPPGTLERTYAWPHMVKLRTGGERPNHKHIGNAAYLLDRRGVALRRNDFSNKIELRGLQHCAELNDIAINYLWSLANANGFEPTPDALYRMLATLADQNRYHPVRDHLDGRTWDGTPRVDRWLAAYLGAEDTSLHCEFGRVVLLGACRRIIEPGCKFDYMLVLEGPQGSFKSSAIKALGSPWFTDSLKLGSDAKVTIEQTSGYWIVEVPELSGMGSREVEAVKAQITTEKDHARGAYDRCASTVPRQFIMIGTTNDRRYLRDKTGNRRFLPVPVGRIDLAALQRDRDQLWAEAYARAKDGEPTVLAETVWAAAAEAQAQRVAVDMISERLAELLDGLSGRVLKTEVYRAFGLKGEYQTSWNRVVNDITDTMERLGWKRSPQRKNGKMRECYLKYAEGVPNDWLRWDGISAEFQLDTDGAAGDDA